MITATLKHNGVALAVISPVKWAERLSEEFDSGTVTYYSTQSTANPPLDGYELTITKKQGSTTSTRTLDFIGTEEVAKVKNGLYKHVVYLTEPTKLLEGTLIDGFAVTQPETNENRKTLYDVIERLLAVNPFDGSIYTITTEQTVVNALLGTISPQFRWNTQTTLYECLMEVGAVINAIPRLLKDSAGEFTVVSFDFINAYKQAATSPFTTDNVNAYGESVDEAQFNSRLAAVVENLIEE